MADLTTAQRLARYRDELVEEGFNATEVARFLETAAPSLIEDIEVQTDLDGMPAVGNVTVRLKPELDPAEIEALVNEVRAAVERATDA